MWLRGMGRQSPRAEPYQQHRWSHRDPRHALPTSNLVLTGVFNLVVKRLFDGFRQLRLGRPPLRVDYEGVIEPTVTELALSPAWTSLEWPGADGVPVASALREGGVSDRVLAIYEWDEATRTWLGYFPGLEDVPGLNTLTSFQQGGTYWVAVTESVAWVVTPGEPVGAIAAAAAPLPVGARVAPSR